MKSEHVAKTKRPFTDAHGPSCTTPPNPTFHVGSCLAAPAILYNCREPSTNRPFLRKTNPISADANSMQSPFTERLMDDCQEMSRGKTNPNEPNLPQATRAPQRTVKPSKGPRRSLSGDRHRLCVVLARPRVPILLPRKHLRSKSLSLAARGQEIFPVLIKLILTWRVFRTYFMMT